MKLFDLLKKNKNLAIAGLIAIAGTAYLYNRYRKDVNSDEDADGTTDATSASFTGNERAFANFGGEVVDPVKGIAPCVKPCPCSDNGAFPYTPTTTPVTPPPTTKGIFNETSPNPNAPFVIGGLKPKGFVTGGTTTPTPPRP